MCTKIVFENERIGFLRAINATSLSTYVDKIHGRGRVYVRYMFGRGYRFNSPTNDFLNRMQEKFKGDTTKIRLIVWRIYSHWSLPDINKNNRILTTTKNNHVIN